MREEVLSNGGDSAIIILQIKVDSLEYPPDFKKIESGMKGLSGVTSLEVNYVNGTVRVYYNPAILTATKIKEKLQELEKEASS